ncbi:winged helix-turn-helix domain-containing protein [Haloferax namakaokahaiae]|uniref:Winged helix-turn-helix domain-containing protein n=1 Tax=Haloferax namakaokahaiae TaxID=1748331 RepID=A0ABD5ZBW5_9EURY
MATRKTSEIIDSETEAAFSLLADETRLSILRVLADSPHERLTFSQLRERVGVADSGRFNYHLGKLTDLFVKKSEGGYELRLAGWMVVGAILAGSYTRGESIGPVPVSAPCAICGGSVEATYADETVAIACADCDAHYTSASIPPGVFEGHDDAELPDVADMYTRSVFSQARLGFCSRCHGRIEPRLVTETNELLMHDCEGPTAAYTCERCHDEHVSSVHLAFIDHPAVVSFYYDHDVDLTQPHLWGSAWRTKPVVELESEDPLRARVEFTVGEETLTLVADEDLEVLDIERQ